MWRAKRLQREYLFCSQRFCLSLSPAPSVVLYIYKYFLQDNLQMLRPEWSLKETCNRKSVFISFIDWNIWNDDLAEVRSHSYAIFQQLQWWWKVTSRNVLVAPPIDTLRSGFVNVQPNYLADCQLRLFVPSTSRCRRYTLHSHQMLALCEMLFKYLANMS